AFRRRVSAKAFHASCTPSVVSSLSSASAVSGSTACATAGPPLRAGLVLPTSSDNRGVFRDTLLRGLAIGGEGGETVDGTLADAGSALAGVSDFKLIFFLTPLRKVRRDEERSVRGPSS